MGFLNSIREVSGRLRDTAASVGGERVFRQYFAKYGRMLDLDIDSRNKTIRIEILPKGEASPIEIKVLEYEVFFDGKEASIAVKKVSASREWIEVLLNDVAVGRKFPIPEKYAGMICLVL